MGRGDGVRRLVVLAAVPLLASACLGGGADDGGGDASGDGDGGGGGGDGRVEIFGAFSGAEEEAFNEALAEFSDESGITVEYVASTDFTTLIRSRVEGGDPPDIALFPQPGLLLSFADGDAVPLGDVLDIGALEETLIPGFLEAATGDDGEVYGAPMRMAVKSLVWYPVPEFEEAGYEVPETYGDLNALEEQIIADGNTPWCLGMEAGADTGWVATDWIEEMMLRLHGPEVYDQWVAHEIPFDSPEVVAAGEAFGEVIFTEGNVLGGPQGTISTPFGESINPMFDDPPSCFLHRQGNFITSFMPEDVQEDVTSHVGIFTLPGMEDGFEGTPLLGGGDLAALFTQDEDSVAVMEFLTSDEFGQPWAEAGGWLSPHATFDPENYGDELDRQIAELATDADVFRFDASDLMPGEVGAGSFWSEMVAWVNGDKELEEALADIEASWPEGGGDDTEEAEG